MGQQPNRHSAVGSNSLTPTLKRNLNKISSAYYQNPSLNNNNSFNDYNDLQFPNQRVNINHLN